MNLEATSLSGRSTAVCVLQKRNFSAPQVSEMEWAGSISFGQDGGEIQNNKRRRFESSPKKKGLKKQ